MEICCVHGVGYGFPSGAVLAAIGKPFCCRRQRVISYMFEELALLRTRGLGSHDDDESHDFDKPGYIMTLGDVFCTLYDMTQTHPQRLARFRSDKIFAASGSSGHY